MSDEVKWRAAIAELEAQRDLLATRAVEATVKLALLQEENDALRAKLANDQAAPA